LIAISPWALYSRTYYGDLWASDNSAVAVAASRAYAQDYQMPPDTIATHPVRWAGRVGVNVVKLVLTLIYAIDTQPILPLSLAGAGIVWMTGRRRGRLRRHRRMLVGSRSVVLRSLRRRSCGAAVVVAVGGRMVF
jgi:hypothetical protein